MPQIAAISSGILSKLGGLKVFLGNLPRLFTYAFVVFIFVSTVSQGFNKFQQTGNIMDFAVSIGIAFIKPFVSADTLLYDTVSKWQSNYSFFQILEGYLTILGALSVIYFIINWTVLGVKSLFPEGMNSNLSIYGMSFFTLFLMMTTYHSLSTGQINFGWSGVMLLFTNFSVVFQPIIAIGERFLSVVNTVPDGVNVPIFQ